MGLDTVELVVSFEKHFGLSIPDTAAENMGTPGDVAAWLGQQLGTTGRRESAARMVVAVHLQQLFAHAPPPVPEATPLLLLLPTRAAQARYAAQLLARYGLMLPELPVAAPPRPSGWLARLFGSERLPLKPALTTSTLADLLDWTVALNYKKLLLPPYRSQYDVEQAVIGLTSDKCGVDVTVMHLRSSFTNDLGMD